MKKHRCELDRLYALRNETEYKKTWFELYNAADHKAKLKMIRELTSKRRLYARLIAEHL